MTSNQPVPLGALLAGMDVTTVHANGERQVGPRQLVPVGLTAVDEHRLLGAEFALQSIGRRLRVQSHRGGVQRTSEWQGLGQQLGAEPVGHQAGELALEIQQFWR